VKPARGRPTENTEAYALFLKAKSAMTRWDAISAEQFLLKAIELDPKFAEAWESLAYTYWEQWGNFIDEATARSRMHNAANRALAINPDLVFAQVFRETSAVGPDVLQREIEELEHILSKQPNNTQALEMLAWDLTLAGYFDEASGLAERQVDLDPLSSNAQLNLHIALYASERIEEAIAALELADQFGSLYTKAALAYVHWQEKHYDISIKYSEADFEARGLASDWVREFHTNAKDPVSGQAYLDQRIPEIMASMPEDRAYEIQQLLQNAYLAHGFLDRYFELIFDLDLSPASWLDAAIPIFNGMTDRSSGFTAHPRFLEIAKIIGHTDMWDERGAPDFCEKQDGQWVCE
jgi:tetratricopeptide (TPR) repeat protein